MMKATVIATENTHRRMGEGRATRDGKKLGGKEIRREGGSSLSVSGCGKDGQDHNHRY